MDYPIEKEAFAITEAVNIAFRSVIGRKEESAHSNYQRDSLRKNYYPQHFAIVSIKTMKAMFESIKHHEARHDQNYV